MPSEFIPCIDCGTEFEFTENDQAFYEQKGYEKPKRCSDCRKVKKQRFAGKDRSQHPH